MSNVLRNNLWVVMIAWSLFLCGYCFMSLLTMLALTVYLYNYTVIENGFRAIVVFSLDSVLLCSSLLAFGFDFLRFALIILVSLNCMMLDGYLQLFDDTDLAGVNIIGLILLTVFLVSSFLAGWRFILVTLMIFVPYLAITLIKVFEKEQKVPFCSYNIKA